MLFEMIGITQVNVINADSAIKKEAEKIVRRYHSSNGSKKTNPVHDTDPVIAITIGKFNRELEFTVVPMNRKSLEELNDKYFYIIRNNVSKEEFADKIEDAFNKVIDCTLEHGKFERCSNCNKIYSEKQKHCPDCCYICNYCNNETVDKECCQSIKNLISYLKDIENNPKIKEKDYLSVTEEIDYLISELILTRGSVNWKNISILKSHGYDVYAGEQDSFGWLTGCIDTNKGTIIFG